MSTTVNLYATKSGYVSEESASTVFPTDSSTWYSVNTETGKRRKLFFGLDPVPNSIKHNVLQNARFLIQRSFSPATVYENLGAKVEPCDDFDPATLTYRNTPYVFTSYYLYNVDGGTGNAWLTYNSGRLGYIASQFAQKNAVCVSGMYAKASNAFVKTVLANGTKPYLELTYDESTKITSEVKFVTNLPTNVRSFEAQTIKWDFYKAESSLYAASEKWDQLSAVFKWRVQGASSWNEIPITGNVKQLTIPANTFSPGSKIEYRLEATDEDNNTSYLTGTRTILSSKITPSSSPTSGYVNPRNSVPFSWNYVDALGTVEAGASTLHWRVSGSENWTNVQAASGATSLTIPANTFQTASTIEWYLSGTDESGYASQTSVYSFSTAAGAVTATAISPSNTIESNNAPITFRWSYSSSDGFQPSRYQFKWKLATDTEYTTLLDETDVVTEYTFPAHTFQAGEIQWGVLPYNIDGVSGTGSTQTFICYGAPAAPVVYAEEKPYTTVTWQANDQQAYKIRVDDTVYGPYFGTEKSFELPDYLEDGEHTVGVSVVGTYGLWSEWGESIITVQNAPGPDIILTAEADVDVTLQITAAGDGQTFLIYRDDVLIGKTGQNTFTDRFALGEHTYRVISKLQDGNYSMSDEVTAEAAVEDLSIAALAGGEWLLIPYSLRDQIDPAYQATVTSTYHHVSGSEYPDAVISPYRDLSVSGSALFLSGQRSEQKRFEELFGKPVIIKFRDGTVFVGVLDSWQKEPNRWHYTAYTFTVRQIEFEDYVNDTE